MMGFAASVISSLNPSLPMSLNLRFSPSLRPLAAILLLVSALFALVPTASAGVISSQAILSETSRETDLATIRQSLEHKQVKQRLNELGFTDREVQQRLAHATDAELHQLATESQALMAGGDGGIIVTVLVIVILVILIMRLT